MKEIKIPTKNYIIYGIIVIVSLLIVFYLNEWYKAYKQNELKNSYIAKYVNEVNYDEFKNYILENPNGIVYMGRTNCEECLAVEKKLYDIADKNEIIEQLIFLNLTDFSNNNNYLNTIKNDFYNSNIITPLSIPAIAIFNEQKIVDILISTDDNKISKSDIIKLLEGQEIIE